MNRRSFLKLLGSLSSLGLPPVRALLSLTEGRQQSADANAGEPFTPGQLEALQKIRYFETQLHQHKGRFSWYLHNELRHYWGAFSEAKSLSHANIILEHSIMDAYIMNTLSDWHYAPEYQPYQPDLAIKSLLRRAENYPEYHYVSAACWLRTGEISSAIGNRILARDCYQQVIKISENYKYQASQLSVYQDRAQSQLKV